MNEYKANELEEIEHPYELEYSSLKSSKNESIKVQNKKENNNNNLLGINNNNYIYQKNQKLMNIQNDDNILNNKIDQNINYNDNYRLNDNIKKNIENLIGINKKNIGLKQKENKSRSKSKNKKVYKKPQKNNINNIHTFSKVDDYWKNREKKNKEKMEIIKKEREKKIYGEVYPIPKINKNTQEIIEKIKGRTYESIPMEDQIEDQINNNIPIKTRQKNMFFKNGFYSKNNSKKNKTNKSLTKFKIKNSYDNLMKIQISNRRPKTPNPKTSKVKKKYKRNKNINKNVDKMSAADLKNLEMIMNLRKKEENEKIKQLEEKMKLENNYIEEEIKEEDEENSPEKKDNKEKPKFNEDSEINEKVHNYLNKRKDLFSNRSKSPDYQNINEIITSRKYLNDILNKDKKIINHSYIQSSSYNEFPRTSNQRNIEVFYKSKNKPKIKEHKIKSTPKLNNSFNTINSFNQNNLNIDSNNLSLYNPRNKSLRYKHYTEGGSYSYKNNNNLSYNNISLNNIKQNNYNEKIQNSLEFDKVNINTNSFIRPNQYKYNRDIDNNNNINLNNINAKIKNKNNENNFLFKQEYNQRARQINKIEKELEGNTIMNQNLLNDAEENLYNNDNEYKNIILKNESINNIFDELDNESLLKYRQENEQKLKELNKKKYSKKNNLPIFLQKELEESKNAINQIDEDIFKKINYQKFQNIINGEQQKIENNLDYYNKELKINEKKKDLLLSKMFGDNYTKQRKRKKFEEDNKNNFINIDINDSNTLGVNKYLIKNNEMDYNKKGNKKEINKYEFVYSPYKKINGTKKEIKKEDFFNDYDKVNIVGNFDFQRRHHFS